MERSVPPEAELAITEPKSEHGFIMQDDDIHNDEIADINDDEMRAGQVQFSTAMSEMERSGGRNRRSAERPSSARVRSSADEGCLVSDPVALRLNWNSIQVGFVDDPRQAVGDAEHLVSTVVDDLVQGFRLQRQRLEASWSEGTDASTDDLRQAFQRYRDFFERLLQL